MQKNSPYQPAVALSADRYPTYRHAIGFLALGFALLCSPISVHAAPVLMTFNGVNGSQDFGYFVGPDTGTMDGAPVDLFCVDFRNEVGFGQQWWANLTPIAGADLSATRYGSLPGASALYQEAAWLTLQFASQPASQYGNIQATIWQLFNASAPTPSSSSWLEQARSNYASGNYTDFRVVTNVGPVLPNGQVQEFLTSVQSNQAPEPGAQLLIGLGLVSLSCAWRYRRP